MKLNTRGYAVVVLLALFAANLAFGQPALSAPADAPVTGVFFIDYDRDGAIDAGEYEPDSDPAFPPNGVTVTAYDGFGNSSAGTVTPGAPPTFSVSSAPLQGVDYRLEFTLDPVDRAAGWAETFHGADSMSSVQFVSAGQDVAFGVVPPSHCPTDGVGSGGNPNSASGKLWTTCFVNGDRDAAGPQEVLVGLNYDTTGSIEPLGMKGDRNDATASSAELGSVWGIAYDEWDSTLFTSAVLKRQSDLGAEGIDGLYWTTYPSGAWNSVSLGSLGGPSFGTEPARDIEGTSFDSQFYDNEAFADVARSGIGDIDITPDGKTLLVANIAAKAINVYDVSGIPNGNNPVFLRSIAVGNPGCSDSANPNDFEIWAISAIDGDTAYAGAVCTAENSAAGTTDLEAHVVNVNIAGSAGPSLFTVPLDYDRGCGGAFDGTCLDPAGTGSFEVWDDVYDGFLGDDSPVFSDIEITSDGSLVLGFFSRESHQVGAGNYPPITGETWLARTNASGEMLHACNVTGDPENPSWVLEGPAGSACDAFNNFADPTGGNFNDGAIHAGPAGFAEWYGDERRTYPTGLASPLRDGHTETALGGLYVNPYFDEVVTSSMDAFGWYTGGLAWMSTTTGQRSNQIDLYSGETDAGYLGKSAGIGDVEGCFIPMEIGDRIWLDLDRDGIQDPDETPLEGVTVVLRDAAGTVIAVGATNAAGNYTFSSADGLLANSTYTITVEPSTNITPLPGGFANADLAPTVQSAGENHLHDSNADATSVISATTATAGTNDHSFDAGFVLPVPATTTTSTTTEAPAATVPPTTTAAPATTEPPATTAAPASTEAPVSTEAPTTEPPTTEPPATVPPATAPPTTTTPTTEPPAAAEPPVTTEAPATTQSPTTQPPTTALPATTNAPATTAAPTTVTPTTTPPATIPPTTATPTTTTTTTTPTTVAPTTTATPTTVPPTIAPPTTTPPIVTTVPVVTAPPPPPPATSPPTTTPPLPSTLPPTPPPTLPPTSAPPTDPSETAEYSIGSLVWADLDNDGLVDPGEQGIEGVTVQLFGDKDGDGHADDRNDDGIITVADATSTTVTDDTGTYMFMGLPPCEYVVGIPPSEWSEQLASHLSSGPTSSSPNDDADNDDNGSPRPNGYVMSGPLTIAGQEPTSDDPQGAPDTFSNKSIDFGFWQPNFDLALRKQLAADTTTAPIGLGETVTFTISIINQGNVTATNISVIDYLPTGLGLVHADWSETSDGNATTFIRGPLAPGATFAINIDLRVESSAFESFANYAEITAATPTSADGSTPLLTPTGEHVADIDSTPDAVNSDVEADDRVDADAANGDEDDHDVAVLNLANPAGATTPSLLAFTGLESQVLVRAALLLILLGMIIVQGAADYHRKER